jgi:DNA polymerase III subunit delta
MNRAGSLTANFSAKRIVDVKLKPVYALVGSDGFLQLQKLAEITSKLPPDAQKLDVDGEKAELADVLDELRSFAMFGGETKIVVVRNADDFLTRFREALENYVENPSTSGILVLRLSSLPGNQRIAKLIAKHGEVCKCEPPGQHELPGWIMQRGKNEHKVTVTLAAANLLADLIGDDLGRIDNELAKLALMVEGGKIDVPDIGRTVSFQREQEMWDLTNAMAVGQTTEALKRWRQLIQLDPSTEFRAVTWIGMWLEDVRKVLGAKRSGQNPQNVLPKFKYRDPKMRIEFVKTAETLGEAGVARALHLLTEVDKQSKSGVGEAATNVERFILSVGRGS